MSQFRLTKTEMMSLLVVAAVLGPLCFGLNRVFLHSFGEPGLPFASFFLMGPFLKTIFFATVQRDMIPRNAKLMVLSSFILVVIGLLFGMAGCLVKNSFLGSFLISTGIVIALSGFMPLQKLASKTSRESPSELSGPN